MKPMRALQGVLALCLVGCIHPADDPPDFPEPSHDFDIPSATTSDTSVVAGDDVPPPAPRLRRTKTLGQSDYDGRAPVAAAAGGPPAQGGTTVIINNNVQQTATSVAYPYALPGQNFSPVYGNGSSSSSNRGGGSSAGASRPPAVGGDWPQVPSYGPR